MFKNIDKIFCITLDTSINRQNEFKERFPELIKSDIFEWFITKRDNENPKRGCSNSHRSVLNIAKERGYSQILTFEDDVNLLVPWTKFVNTINEIQYPDNWKAIQIGYLPFTLSKVPNNETLVYINCSVCMHAYISNVSKLEIPVFDSTEVDVKLFCPTFSNFFLRKNNDGMYGIYPNMLVKQNASDSTIDPVGRKYLGSMTHDRDVIIQMALHFYPLLLLIALIIIPIFIYFVIKKRKA